jgi:hypothetical protein
MERELVVLGVKRMRGGHAAENVKASIEDIVNQYDFDKSNIVVCIEFLVLIVLTCLFIFL